MRCFFIDYRDTEKVLYLGMDKLAEDDMLVVWLGQEYDCGKVKALIEGLGFKGVLKIEQNPVQSAINFNLVFSIQMYAAKTDKVFVISKSRTYDAIFPQMRELGWSVARFPTLAEALGYSVVYLNVGMAEDAAYKKIYHEMFAAKNKATLLAYCVSRLGPEKGSGLFSMLERFFSK